MIRKCELCDFTTKNAFFFKRHKVRCRRDHGIVRGGRQKFAKDASVDNADANTTLDSTLEEPKEHIDGTEAGTSLVMEGTDGSSKMEVDSHSDLAVSESSSIVGSQSQNGAEITEAPCKAEPAKKRLYQCTKCEFVCKSSRKFLYHQVEIHKVSMNIYTCEYCEYSSRFRHKVLRHMKAGHSADISTLQNLQPEYVSTQAPFPVKPKTSVPVKPRLTGANKRALISKHGAGKRKLMVKFGRPQTGATVTSSEPEVPKSNIPPLVSVPIKDRLSRVVEEVDLGNGEVTFKCKECTFVCEDRQMVAKHAVSWHVDTKSFTCSHCDYITFERTDFISHRLTHRNEHQFKCDECTYSTDFRPNYDRHMSNHKGSFPYKCSLCTFGCGSLTVIRRHMANNHTPIPPQFTVVPPPAKKLKLPVPKPTGSVDKTTAAVSATATSSTPVKDISTVKITHSPSKSPQKTPEKPQQFPDLSDPLDQSSANYLFQMSKASFLESDSVSMVPRPTIPPPSLDYTGLLGRELSPQRKLPPNITQYVEKDNGKLVCPVCKLKYKRSSDLNRHMKRKHGVKLREYLENCAESGLLPGVNASSLAELSFGDDDGDMDEHDDTDDVNDGDNNDSGMMESEESPLDLSLRTDSDDSPVPAEKLKCKYCNYQAKWLSDLKRHYSVHSIEKRYKCNYCTKKYKYIGDLNVHVRKDHNKEPGEVKVVKVATMAKRKTSPAIFKCPCCNYTSAWKSEVDRHSRLHTGEKTFQCSKCDYQTYWRGDIRRHVYKRHPDIMGEGVAIDDVIIKKKARSPVLLPGGVDRSSHLDQDRPEDCMDSSFQSDGERLSREVTPTKMNVSRSHEPSPEVNMSDYVTKCVSGHSPTPSPIKELGAGMYKCQYCGFIANAPSKMNSHIATHTNLKRYMCPVCGRRANWKWDIAKHIRRDHNDQITQVIKLSKHEAEETIQTYMDSNPVVRRDHHLNLSPERTLGTENTDQYYKCSLCDFSAEKRISVARHMRYMHVNVGQHGNILMVKRSSPGKRPEVDQDQVAAMEELKAGHVTPEKMSPQHVSPTKPILDPKKSMYVTAPSSTSSPAKYTHLVENFGPQDAAKPFMCSECGKRGATKGDVKKHYHYAHADKEIRIIYLGDGSQSVYSAKADIGPGMPEKPPAPEPEVATAPVQPPQAAENSTPNTSGVKSICKTPKVVGYIKPYVCGLCGRRSNWRWDMSKHIRERHPGQEVRIIELTEEEARGTIQDYINNVLPRLNRASNSVPKRRNKDSVQTSSKEDQEQIQKSVANIVKARDESKQVEQIVDDKLPEGGSYSFAGAPVVGQFKQYKCSGCAYRSNYRSDIQRHIPRRHGQHAKVILLDKETARATLDSYTYKRCYDSTSTQTKKSSSGGHAARTTPTGTPSGPLPKEAWAGLEKKIWKCSMCAYSNEDKVDVLKHVGKHNLKAYKCTTCNWTSNFRSAVQRHIQSKHPTDDIAQCRLSIKLIKEGPGVDQSGRSIMPDGVAAAENFANQSENSAESLPSQITAITGLQSMNNPQSFMSTALYYCKVCNFNSTWRSCVCRHLLKIHRRKDYVAQIVKKIVRTSIVPQQTTAMSSSSSPSQSSVQMPMAVPSSPAASPRKKNFHCNVCPYKTYKGKMLKFHMTCHKPQPGVKQVKCKYCPYYVSSNRLLSQHLNLHLKDFKSNPELMFYPTTPMKAPLPTTSKSPQAPKRHRCEKCPYTTNSKNDFLYHKQFHRPKPTADYKCDFCDYWVSHRRLIKQHMKVHEEEGYYSDSIATPSKSEYSENSLVYDTVEIAAIKQRIIASKITPSISQSPLVSPMKIASSCSVGGRRSFLRKDGTYRKIHQCRHCPYMNIRLRNMKLHELMHGKRSATHPLMKCPHCDYYVGSKGLLAHHMKVHQPNYGIDYIGQEKEKDRRDSRASEDSEMDSSIATENKVDTLLEITRFKKYGCEKCPYASSKRSRFQRHVEMHGSKQKCKCDFCDYSVPTMNLLNQHMRLHFEPNQNLLAAQSILNLQYLPEMPADVALASMMTNNDSKNPVSITHDHIDLYENQPEDLEPKKLYRCDRCPYANIRRDHLLAHLRCHMVKNEYACPYCDYSVGKTHVLVQHVKVHFSPLPEFSEWLAENGDKERIKEVKNKDMKEAMEVVKLFQNEKKGESKVNGDSVNGEKVKENGTSQENIGTDVKRSGGETIELVGEETTEKDIEQKEKMKLNGKKTDKASEVSGSSEEKNQAVKNEMNGKPGVTDEQMDVDTKDAANGSEETKDVKEKVETEDVSYVCQYCDRDFPTSDCLVRHEMQHLIGNNYEELVHQLVKAAEVQQPPDQSVSNQDMKTESQSNGKAEETGSLEDEVKPGTSGIGKPAKGVNKGKSKDSSEEVVMETD
ncbi:uncharacterized protein LOC123548380 isoform X2 [Mercenaria mercenaria]|uniref:uncharacterized protein LOC123548380 isoform X2 n=1 Tax=Mercenaria mercenaria TaxID=6596 RepID=UPI00234E8710|nr:uncharacterized protein LOC123548380 isoform X2 [Mercenaria mercenaria]